MIKYSRLTQFFLSSVPSLSFFLPHYHISLCSPSSLPPSPFPHSLFTFYFSTLPPFPPSFSLPSLLQSFIFSLPSVPPFILHFLFAITPALSPSFIAFFPPSLPHSFTSSLISLLPSSFLLFSSLPISLKNFPPLTLSKINLHANFMSS